jgi:predicted DNA-binding protein (UPF0251 family)
MPRPQKCRQVSNLPNVIFFKPAGIPMTKLEEVPLTVDEYEAIRWVDLENLRHDEAALRMGISRPTFTRMLTRAHRRVAAALVQGKALRINGGNYQLNAVWPEDGKHERPRQERQRERARNNP